MNATIENLRIFLEERDIGGNKMQFYILQILGNDPKSAAGSDKIMVPVSNAKNVGLRSLLSEEDITDIFEILNEEPVAFDNQTWNRRYRGFMEKIKTGSLFEIAEVFRDLHRLKRTKTLAFGERRMLETARGLIVQELSVAKGLSAAKIEGAGVSHRRDALQTCGAEQLEPLALEHPRDPRSEGVSSWHTKTATLSRLRRGVVLGNHE